VSLAYATGGCGDGPAKAPDDASRTADAPLPPPAYEAALPEGVREHLYERFTGDFDQMAKRSFVRVGTTFNRTFYFVDNGVQRGAAYEMGRAEPGRAERRPEGKGPASGRDPGRPGEPRGRRPARDANAGLIPIVVVHDYLATFWTKILTNLTVHDEVKVRTGASLGVAIRKRSPLLAAELNAFLAKNGLGTALGNVVEKRYLVNTSFAKQANAEASRKKLRELVPFFQKYGEAVRSEAK
jgi:hypothetical protein